jgi:hypothetical protein
MRSTLAIPLLAVLLTGCASPGPKPAPAPQPARTELEGLRADATGVKRASPARVEIAYGLEWTATPSAAFAPDGTIKVSNVWILGPSEPAVIHFWDAAGKSAGEASQRISLPDAFLNRTVPRRAVSIAADVPAGGVAVSVALGNSGLETARVVLP